MQFLIHGVCGDTHLYNKECERIELLSQPSYAYKGELTPHSSNGKTCSTIVDQAIKITAYDTNYRQQESDYWKKKKVIALIPLLLGTHFGVIGAAVVFPALPMLGLALTVICIASTILGLRRTIQAHYQKSKWDSDFLEHARQARMNPSEKNIFAHKLKGTLFHPEECKAIWEDESKKFAERFASIKVGSVTNRDSDVFFTDNPLLKERRDYAGTQFNMHLQAYIDYVQSLYLGLKLQPHKLTESYRKEYQKIGLAKGDVFKQFEILRDAERKKLSISKRRCEKEKCAALDQVGDDEQNRCQIEKTFDQRIKTIDDRIVQLNLFHTETMSSIISHFNEQEKILAKWYEREFDKIKNMKSKITEHFSPNVGYICHTFLKRNDELSTKKPKINAERISDPPILQPLPLEVMNRQKDYEKISDDK